MGRPARHGSPNRPHPLQPVAALDQCLGVAGEGGGVARDVGDPRHRRACKDRDLLLGPGAGWIEHDRVETAQLLRIQRAPEEVAMIDEEPALAAVGGSLQRQSGVAPTLDGEDAAFERESEGAEAGEQVGDDAGRPHRLPHRFDERRLPSLVA